MRTNKFFYYGKFVVLGIAGMILFTFVVMWLWNWLVPELFNGPVIVFWQTLGLLVLSKILFSGIGGGHSKHPGPKFDDKCGDRDKWRKKFEDKMNGKVEEKDVEGEVVEPE